MNFIAEVSRVCTAIGFDNLNDFCGQADITFEIDDVLVEWPSVIELDNGNNWENFPIHFCNTFLFTEGDTRVPGLYIIECTPEVKDIGTYQIKVIWNTPQGTSFERIVSWDVDFDCESTSWPVDSFEIYPAIPVEVNIDEAANFTVNKANDYFGTESNIFRCGPRSI